MKHVVLGTGLSGMVGSRFVDLYKQTYDFENIDLSTGIDITKADQVEQMVSQSKSPVIINLAAFTNVSAANEQKGDKSGLCYQLNVEGTRNILDSARRHQKYLIHISTDFVFDGTKNGEYHESDTPHPIEWYGETKLMAEQLVTTYASSAILRITYPYQAKPIRPDFLAIMLEKLKNGTLPPPFADHYITPTFVDDIAKVLDYCIQHQPQGLYHVVGSSYLSDFQIAQMVNDTFQLNAQIKPGSLQEYLKTTSRPYQQRLQTSNAKLTADLGVTMKSFEEGLKAVKQQLGV